MEFEFRELLFGGEKMRLGLCFWGQKNRVETWIVLEKKSWILVENWRCKAGVKETRGIFVCLVYFVYREKKRKKKKKKRKQVFFFALFGIKNEVGMIFFSVFLRVWGVKLIYELIDKKGF
jgi:hypothetical protein